MFNYFGSKQRLAPTYQPPGYDVIVEPFAGAAAYSVYWLKQRSDIEAVLFDVDPMVVGLWRRILEMSPDELWTYPDPVVGQMSSDMLWGSCASATSSWRSVAAGRQFQVTEWMARDFPTIKRRMAADLAEIGGGRIKVVEASWDTVPNMSATWFIDPPYQHQGHRYTSGNGIDFDLLGRWCQSRQGQVIVTEAAPADWLDFEPHRIHQDQTNQKRMELVWYSHPEPTLLDIMGAAET